MITVKANVWLNAGILLCNLGSLQIFEMFLKT